MCKSKSINSPNIHVKARNVWVGDKIYIVSAQMETQCTGANATLGGHCVNFIHLRFVPRTDVMQIFLNE